MARMPMDKSEFAERVVIVTGAGSGIGRAMALRFAAGGAKVLASDIHGEAAEETRSLIEQAGGIVKMTRTDVGDETSIADMVASAVSAWGQIDVLCNNAGVTDRMEVVTNLSTAQWERIIRINLTGVMFGTRAVLPYMLERKAGSIVNTASEAGLRGGASGAAYTVAKHGVVGLTRNVAWSYAKQNIRCNAICPGYVGTNIFSAQAITELDPMGLEVCAPVSALGTRKAEPDEMATVAYFLASDAAAFINGAIIPVDYAWSAG